MDIMRKILIGFFMSLMVSVALATTSFSTLLPGAQKVGQGLFKRFGWSIYEATLFTPSGRFEARQPYALSLTYERTIAGDRLVQSSIDEMRKLGAPIDTHPNWATALARVLPSVSKGVTLTGVYRPGEGATFYLMNDEIGRIDDDLARWFFAIWLDPKTSEPSLRQALLGVSP